MRFLFAILTMLLGATLYGQSEVEKDFVARMQAIGSSITTITSEFTQTQKMAIFADSEVSAGRFYYMNDGRMKWAQEEPMITSFVFDGDAAYVYDGQEKEELSAKNPRVSAFKKFILGTVDGSIFSDKNFERNFVREENRVKIEMVPLKKALKRRFEKILLTFDYDKMVLLELVFLEKNSDKRTIQFYNHELNVDLDVSIFE